MKKTEKIQDIVGQGTIGRSITFSTRDRILATDILTTLSAVRDYTADRCNSIVVYKRDENGCKVKDENGCSVEVCNIRNADAIAMLDKAIKLFSEIAITNDEDESVFE